MVEIVFDVLCTKGEVEEFTCDSEAIVQPPLKRYHPGIIHKGKERFMLRETITPN